MSREADLYKDKIEVSLDGRQIFYLFFGGAVIVGLVFVLGVMVGRRVEARGHVEHAQTTAAADPLAALDRLESKPSSLRFKGALMNKGGTEEPTDVEKTIAELEKARAKSAAEPPRPAAKPEVKAEPKPEPEPKAEAKPEPKAEPKAEPKPEPKADKAAKAEKPAKVEAEAAGGDKPITKPQDVEKKQTKYTLQLSSFQDKSEAESFLAQMKAAGYQAYVTEAAVAGKGTFYRVRMGTYRSLDAANDAKADFEKASSKSASVMKL